MILDVERSGGLGGLALTASVPLEGLSPEEREAVEQALGRPPQAPSGPDRFVYRLRVGDRQGTVHEDQLTPTLARVVARLAPSWRLAHGS